jgi:hypothetical protein
MQDVIFTISRDADLSADQSLCLELLEEAWEEPRHLSECPKLHIPLDSEMSQAAEFNPFVVDKSGIFA